MMHPMAIGEGREAELDGVQGHCPCRGAGQRPALVVAKGHLTANVLHFPPLLSPSSRQRSCSLRLPAVNFAPAVGERAHLRRC